MTNIANAGNLGEARDAVTTWRRNDLPSSRLSSRLRRRRVVASGSDITGHHRLRHIVHWRPISPTALPRRNRKIPTRSQRSKIDCVQGCKWQWWPVATWSSLLSRWSVTGGQCLRLRWRTTRYGQCGLAAAGGDNDNVIVSSMSTNKLTDTSGDHHHTRTRCFLSNAAIVTVQPVVYTVCLFYQLSYCANRSLLVSNLRSLSYV